MRVQNGAIESSGGSSRPDAAQNSGLAAKSNTKPLEGGSSDFVSLSNASSLVTLAHGMVPAEKQAKFAAVSAQFLAGEYHADAPGVSQAMVQGHLQG